ncbi:MAG: hypothetical protein KUG81_09965 [Gammaproteobacteria bacterium]|nr:hypothetical protein [Gammaproteobacteria bacterium]
MKTTKSIRMDESLVNAITARAEKERRTFHSMTLCLLEDALKQSSGDVIWMTEKEAQALTAKETGNNVVTTKPKKKVAKFVKPTVDDVRGYCMEKGYTFDPEAFVANYESKGWLINKTKMKSWKAACTTWHKRDLQKVATQPVSTTKNRPIEHDLNDDSWAN